MCNDADDVRHKLRTLEGVERAELRPMRALFMGEGAAIQSPAVSCECAAPPPGAARSSSCSSSNKSLLSSLSSSASRRIAAVGLKSSSSSSALYVRGRGRVNQDSDIQRVGSADGARTIGARTTSLHFHWTLPPHAPMIHNAVKRRVFHWLPRARGVQPRVDAAMRRYWRWLFSPWEAVWVG